MNLLFTRHPNYLLALARAAGKAMLGLLLIGLAAGSLRAQEPDNSALTNAMEAMALAATNASMQAEDLAAALRSLQTEEPAMPEDAAGTNNAPADAGNDGASSRSSSGDYFRRPSGRESRSRWSSRQRTNRFGADAVSGSAPSNPATNAGPASLSYDSFRLIAQNNIFDPNRRPHRITPTHEATPSRDPVYFTLVGTMSYEEGTFAFFSGSSSFYQKALKCSDTIGGYTLAHIEPDSVTLAQDTNQVVLKVGMQMRQSEDGNWTPSNPPTTYTVNDFQPASTSSPAGAAPSGPENEILKRLMEKREKE